MPLIGQHRLGNNALHDFIGAAINPLNPRIRKHAGNRVFPHVAVTTVQLQALVDHFALQVGNIVFASRRGRNIQFFLQVQFQAAVHIGAGHFKLGVHLGNLELGVLETGDRLAEGLSFLHVFDGVRQRRLGHGQTTNGNTETLLGAIPSSGK